MKKEKDPTYHFLGKDYVCPHCGGTVQFEKSDLPDITIHWDGATLRGDGDRVIHVTMDKHPAIEAECLYCDHDVLFREVQE